MISWTIQWQIMQQRLFWVTCGPKQQVLQAGELPQVPLFLRCLKLTT